MREKCEFCGRFGAKKGQYIHPDDQLSVHHTMTLYLCPRCDTRQRLADVKTRAEAEREIEERKAAQ